MPRVSEAHKAEVRQRLLDAAQVCLERNGYRDITTRELLAEAGLSNGTLYTYFPTKDHLYEALAEDLLDADRMRLTADGRLRMCLLVDGEINFKTILRNGGTHRDLVAMFERAIQVKPVGHELKFGVHPENRTMSQIGG